MSILRTNEIQTTAGKKILGTSGTVIQTIQSIVSATWASAGQSATSFLTVDGYTASITPSSNTNKILVMMQMHIATNYWEMQGKITRNGSVITESLGAARGSRVAASFCAQNYDGQSTYGYNWITIGYNYLDSPGTTSTCTYGLQLNGYSTYQIFLNRTGQDYDTADYHGCPASTITLMEVTA